MPWSPRWPVCPTPNSACVRTELRDRLDKGRDPGRHPARRLRHRPRGGQAHPRQRHFDVQLMGGMVLHQAKIAEMRTGEGKTLVATLPVYLNAIDGKGVHVVTVNDYLAKRDSDWMGRIYNFLGLTVGVIVHGLDDFERKSAYQADITYGTNNEFGFDYLRDNMKFRLEEMVQRGFNFAIVDEVDCILIDEARTPLIISGPSTETVRALHRRRQGDPAPGADRLREGREGARRQHDRDPAPRRSSRSCATWAS